MITERERFVATLQHQRPDRVPFQPGNGRNSTLRRWRKEGLSPEVIDYHGMIRQQLGIPPITTQTETVPVIEFRMLPMFEEKILERRPPPPGSTARGTRIWQDWKGNICEIEDDDAVFTSGFVTRSWLKCPVETRADWPDMERRYDADDPQRFPTNFVGVARRVEHRDYPSSLIFPGPFWQLREWCGFEGLCMLFLDDPDFVREMIRVWRNFVSAMLRKTFLHYVPDSVIINEDMAYKEKPMINPAMCREFLLPTWREWGEICRSAGVPVYDLDSDGYVGSLIPVWIEAGFTCNSPQEVAAGNDLPAYSRTFGKRMAYRGGVDKRAIAKGGAAIRAEIARLQPAIDAGGYIPGCDHGVPDDISWPNFLEYCRLLARATGWLT